MGLFEVQVRSVQRSERRQLLQSDSVSLLFLVPDSYLHAHRLLVSLLLLFIHRQDFVLSRRQPIHGQIHLECRLKAHTRSSLKKKARGPRFNECLLETWRVSHKQRDHFCYQSSLLLVVLLLFPCSIFFCIFK